MTIADQIQSVRQNILECCTMAGRPKESVKLLAVSKTHPFSAIQEAYESGITEFGESYLQEALEKIEQAKDLPIQWHFIGPVQSNKTRLIANSFDWVESVDRAKILLRLSEQRPRSMKPLNICIQTNFFNETQKQGVDQNQLPDLLNLADTLPNIQLRGLMAIPPRQTDYEAQLSQFQTVLSAYKECQKKYSSMDTLSIGMSGDLKAAIHAGSTMVRVGTGIFGQRNTQ